MRSIQAIVRSALHVPLAHASKPVLSHEMVELPAGSIVRCFREAVQAEVLSVTRETDPDTLLHVPRADLLLLSEFLRRQPTSDEFWILLNHQVLLFEGRDYLLQDAPKAHLGSKPWRFESEGEALWYAHSRGLLLTRWSIGHVQPMNRLCKWK